MIGGTPYVSVIMLILAAIFVFMCGIYIGGSFSASTSITSHPMEVPFVQNQASGNQASFGGVYDMVKQVGSGIKEEFTQEVFGGQDEGAENGEDPKMLRGKEEGDFLSGFGFGGKKLSPTGPPGDVDANKGHEILQDPHNLKFSMPSQSALSSLLDGSMNAGWTDFVTMNSPMGT